MTTACTVPSTLLQLSSETALSTRISPVASATSAFAPLPVPSLVPASFPGETLTSLALSAASSATPTEVITALDDVQGTLSIANGFVTTDLITPFGPLQATYDVVTLATDLNTEFQAISGTLALSGGFASGNLVVGDDEFTATNFEFANLVSGFVADLLTSLDGTVPFANGVVAIDLPTPIGDIEGTIGFGSGALAVNLNTPLLPLNFTIEFPDEAQFAFPVAQLGTDAILNLATGQVEIDLIPVLGGAEVVVPITALAGSVAFANGLANLSVEAGFTTVQTQFNLATEVEETLLEFLSTASGTLTIGAGSLGANLQSNLGSFAGVFPASQLFSDFIATLPLYQGTIALAGGVATVDLTTPNGVLQGSLDYGQYLTAIATIVGDLVAT